MIYSTQGHSTPAGAAETALLFGAKRMLLNHISPQFNISGVSICSYCAVYTIYNLYFYTLYELYILYYMLYTIYYIL